MGRLREKLGSAMHSRKVRLALLGVAAVALVLAGVALYMQKRAATLEYAVKQLNLAIATSNVEQLGRMVDVLALAEQLAAAMVSAQPGQGEDAFQKNQDLVQHKLLAMFTAGKEGGGGGHGAAPKEAGKEGGKKEGGGHGAPPKEAGKEGGGHGSPAKESFAAGATGPPPSPLEDAIFDIMKKPVVVLPADTLDQLKDHPLTIQVRDEHAAILLTSVEHDQIKHTFTLRLAMQKTDQGWRVVGLVNSLQIVKEFWDRINAMKQEALEAFDQENIRQRSLMSTYYHIDTCASTLFPRDTSGVVRLRINLAGSNMGERDLISSASTCALLDRTGAKVASLRLENTRVVKVDEAFEHSWFYNFEESFPEVEALVKAGEVRCEAEASAVSLGRGLLLRTRGLKEFPGVRFE